MGLLTWIPKDLQTRFDAEDPARRGVPAARRAVDELLAGEADTVVSIAPSVPGSPRPRAARWLVPIFAAAVVAAVTAGVLVLATTQSHRMGGGQHPIGSSPASTGGSSSNQYVDAAARLWAAFPVERSPRPIVLTGTAVSGPDAFSDGVSKNAFGEGRLRLATTLPSASDSQGGYPIMPAAQAITELTENPPRGPGVWDLSLPVTSVQLSTHAYSTDRGYMNLPAWRISIGRATGDVYVLAVAAQARFPDILADAQPSGLAAVASTDGHDLTINFVARHDSTGVCDHGYTSSLQVDQTPTAVLIAISVVDDTPTPMPSNTGCLMPLHGLPPPIPGAPNTRTIHLDQPLGARVLINAGATNNGIPYNVSGQR